MPQSSTTGRQQRCAASQTWSQPERRGDLRVRHHPSCSSSVLPRSRRRPAVTRCTRRLDPVRAARRGTARCTGTPPGAAPAIIAMPLPQRRARPIPPAARAARRRNPPSRVVSSTAAGGAPAARAAGAASSTAAAPPGQHLRPVGHRVRGLQHDLRRARAHDARQGPARDRHRPLHRAGRHDQAAGCGCPRRRPPREHGPPRPRGRPARP